MDLIALRGETIAVEFVNTGNGGQLQTLLDDWGSKDPARHHAGRIAFIASVVTLARLLEAVKRKGAATFSGVPLPTMAEVAYAATVGGKQFDRVSQTLVNATHGLYRATQGKVTVSLPRAGDGPVAAPMKVEVVSMPTRKTVTDVSRNMAGEITGSLQLEADV